MAKESISQNRLKELLHYCPDTGVFTWIKNRGSNIVKGKTAGGVTGFGYLGIRVNGTRYLAHRLAFLYVTGRMPAEAVDHINRAKTDNSFSNLRLVTQSTNMRNASLRSDSTSGVAGVYYFTDRNKWNVKIMTASGRVDLGCHEQKWDAICARLSAENIHGYLR